MRYTQAMSEIIFPELKKALSRAALGYLNDPRTKKSTSTIRLFRWASDVFHGDVGRFRAENLKRSVDDHNHISSDDIFILLNAIFKSNAKLLKEYIANEFFVGKYEKTIIPGEGSYEGGDLTTPVFSADFFERVKYDSDAYDSYPSEGSLGMVFNNVSAVQSLLASLVKQYAKNKDFENVVTQRLKELETKPAEIELQMRDLGSCTASAAFQ